MPSFGGDKTERNAENAAHGLCLTGVTTRDTYQEQQARIKELEAQLEHN